jgi:hypothetical protein
VLALISVRITGLKALESYGHSLFFMSHEASNPAGEAKYAMFSAQMPNLYGFFHSISHGAPWGLALTFLSSLWGSFIDFDYHYLVAVPVAALFACFAPTHIPTPASRVGSSIAALIRAEEKGKEYV